MVNIIFSKVPNGNFGTKTYILIEEREKITWNSIFNFLEQQTNISSIYFILKINGKLYKNTPQLEPFKFDDFVNLGDTGDFITVQVDYNIPKLLNRGNTLKYKISILEASISSMRACNLSVTDLLMELNHLKKLDQLKN